MKCEYNKRCVTWASQNCTNKDFYDLVCDLVTTLETDI